MGRGSGPCQLEHPHLGHTQPPHSAVFADRSIHRQVRLRRPPMEAVRFAARRVLQPAGSNNRHRLQQPPLARHRRRPADSQVPGQRGRRERSVHATAGMLCRPRGQHHSGRLAQLPRSGLHTERHFQVQVRLAGHRTRPDGPTQRRLCHPGRHLASGRLWQS